MLWAVCPQMLWELNRKTYTEHQSDHHIFSFTPYVHALAVFLICILVPWETSPGNLLDPCYSPFQGVRPCLFISSQLLDLFQFSYPGLPHNLARIFFVLKSLLLTAFTTLNSYVIGHLFHSEVSCIPELYGFEYSPPFSLASGKSHVSGSFMTAREAQHATWIYLLEA